MGSTIDIRHATDRFHTTIDWLDSWHSFSFGNHYDPKNVNHGLLLVPTTTGSPPGAASRATRTATWRS